LIFSAFIVSGCATTAHVSISHLHKDSTVFIISNENDAIGVGPVIAKEVSKRGYHVKSINSHKKESSKKSHPVAAFGSGFFISENGLLISNAHVVKNASSIIIRKVDGEKFRAKVIIIDENNDIAILTPIEPISVDKWLSLTQFKNTKIGDPLKIIGFPLSNILGNRPRVTEGIISADAGLMDDPTRFQVSASIQPGNSGGPIIDEKHEVIGVTTEKLSDFYSIKTTGTIPQNVNFGVKIDYAKLLFNHKIEQSVTTKLSNTASLKDAIDATALIAVNVEEISEITSSPKKQKTILVTYSYNYSWDVFHYTLSRFNMQWIDQNTGEIIADGNFSGGSFLSYIGIVEGVIKEVFIKAGIDLTK